MNRLTPVFALLLLSLTALAAELVPGLRTDPSGAFQFAGLSFQVIHFDPTWSMTGQRSETKVDVGFPKTDSTSAEFSAAFTTKAGVFALRETIKRIDASAISCDISLTSAEPVQTNTLALTTSLTTDRYAGVQVVIDDQSLKLPEKFKDMGVFRKQGAKKLRLPTSTGYLDLEGSFTVSIQDDRKFGSGQFSVRIAFAPDAGAIKSAKLQLTLRSAIDSAKSLPPEIPTIITAGADWKPIEHTLDIEPGGILDFSNLLDAPAGKYGQVVVKGSRFEFANRPGQRVRFFGTNLCFSANYPTKEQAEKIAQRLARIGYNAVRTHHYDRDLCDRNAPDSTTLDPAQLDRYDYFISCLKKQGIYLNIDLFTIRQPRASEIPELNRIGMDGFKATVPLLDSAMKNWQGFAKNLLTHKNPYTDLTLAEDPVLIGICPLNEDPLAIVYNAAPDVRKLYDQRFEQWLKQKDLNPQDKAERDRLLSRFLSDLQVEANRKTFAFLKSLGVKAPLTSVNCLDAMALTPVRAEEEYVDNHAYWDHPGFPERQWSMPYSYRNNSAVAAGAQVPRTMMPTRIVGKPFTCTEINYCPPNRYRAEGGPLLGAYAALQDWDGLYRFAESHNIANLLKASAIGGFDNATDPLSLMSERIAALMFFRADVAPAKRIIPYLVSNETAHTAPPGWGRGQFPQEFSYLGLHTGIGSIHVESDHPPIKSFPIVSGSTRLPGGIYAETKFLPGDTMLLESIASNKLAPDGAFDVKTKHIVSDTGEITLSGDAGTFQVVTDRTECFILRDPGELRGRSVSVRNDGGFSVVCVSAMDGKSIAQSGRLLVFHLTDVQNTKTRYRNDKMNLLEQWGTLPHLVRAGKAQVQIQGGRPAKAFALDLAGRRGQAIELVGAAIPLDTARGCLVYEVTR